MNRPNRHVAVAFLVAALACCTSWGRPASWNPGVLANRPARLRVTLTDGRTFDVERPVARGDTLAGDTLSDSGGLHRDRRPVAIPFAGVRSVSERRFSAGRTALLGGGIVAVIAAVKLAIGSSVHSSSSEPLLGGATCQGRGHE